MPIGDTPPATLPVQWPPFYERALSLLRERANSNLKEHNTSVLLSLLWSRASGGELTTTGLRSGELEDLAYSYYAKSPPFALQAPGEHWLRLFQEQVTTGRHANDWRAAFNSQRGFGCFGTDSEIATPSFRAEERKDCQHRRARAGGQGAPMDIGCDLSPARGSPPTHTPCWDVRQGVAQAPKLLQQWPDGGNYRYRWVEPEPEGIRLLTGPSPGDKLPALPLVAALYGGSPALNANRRRKGVDDLLHDHAIDPSWRDDLLVLDPGESANRRLLAMTEAELLRRLHEFFSDHGLMLRLDEVINFHLSLKPRGFVVLSGISGTGKSWLSRLYAEALLGGERSAGDNFALIPVQPNWRDQTYLLGFHNHLTGQFEEGPLYGAFQQAVAQPDGLPYLVLLDETNLARVEHYFADYLSVMETRSDGNPGAPVVFGPGKELTIPDNLFIVGTVNVDESTHGLSRKVLDRANTIELDDVDLAVMPSARQPPAPSQLKVLAEHLRDREFRGLAAVQAAEPTKLAEWNEFVIAAHDILKQKRRHFGARVRDEIVMYMAYAYNVLSDAQAAKTDLGDFDERRALDYQFLQKVVPRLFGTKEEIGTLLDDLGTFAEQEQLALTKAKLERMAQQEIVSPWTA